MEDVTKYPIDFESLEKGTIITREALEEIYGITPLSPEWPFRLMKLIADIKENAGMLCRQSRNCIVVMTDAEACDYTHDSFLRYGRRMGASSRNRALIDTSSFSAIDQAKFESRSRIMTGTQQAATTELKKLTKIERLLDAGAEDQEAVS